MILYHAQHDTVRVLSGASDVPLDPRRDLVDYGAPFAWGAGADPDGIRQLALALCAHALGPGAEAKAIRVHDRFTLWVALQPADRWMRIDADVRLEIDRIEPRMRGKEG